MKIVKKAISGTFKKIPGTLASFNAGFICFSLNFHQNTINIKYPHDCEKRKNLSLDLYLNVFKTIPQLHLLQTCEEYIRMVNRGEDLVFTDIVIL